MATKIINKKMLEIIQKEEPMGIGEESNCYFLKGTSDIIKIYFQPKRLNNIKFADKALYMAKALGRNKVISYNEIIS